MQIRITKNNISEKIDEYKKRTGASKVWIASKLDMSSQRLHAICQANNIMLDIALKFSIFLECDIKELFDYEIIE